MEMSDTCGLILEGRPQLLLKPTKVYSPCLHEQIMFMIIDFISIIIFINIII